MNALKRTWFAASAVAALLLTAAPARAQYRDEYGDQSRNEYGDVRQTVARIAWIEGSASFARGDDPDNWQPADRNVPMTLGDRVYTGRRSRLELEVHGGDAVRIGAGTDLAALNLTDDTKQFSVKSGIATFNIRHLDENEVYEVDTPNSAVTFDREGEYRVDVDPDGNTRVSVYHGAAEVAAGGGQVPVREGDAMEIWGIDRPEYDMVGLRGPDGWDNWVRARESRRLRARSYAYVSASIGGVGDLDDAGRWEDVPEYGRCWTPTVVAADWAPYRVGHWVWQDPWGWTWISAEPWGWAPYHYGRWVTWSSRWYWVPVARRVAYVEYSPALVAFVGGGPGWSASISFGGGAGFVGWFPLAPRDPLNPWWGERRATYQTNVTNITYVNKTYVTVVNQNTFVSGAPVAASVVRDRAVVQQVVSAPVTRGPIPVVPTQASLRFAARPNLPAPPRPSAAVVSRAVVARVAPPPAPPAFAQKVQVIRENRGAPVAPAAAARISVQERGAPRAINQVRPVAPAQGQVNLAPRNPSAGAPARVQPVVPSRGRPMATTQQPVAAAPVTGGSAPARPAPQGAIPQRGVPERATTVPAAPGRPTPVAPEALPERGRPVQPVPTPPVAAPSERRPAIRPEPTRPADESWRDRQRIERAPAPAETPERRAPGLERGGPEPARPQPTPPAYGRERGRAMERPAPTPVPTSPPERVQQRQRIESAPPAYQPQRGRAVERPPAPEPTSPSERVRPERQRPEAAPPPPQERGERAAPPRGPAPERTAPPRGRPTPTKEPS
jgi:hypothetical protein